MKRGLDTGAGHKSFKNRTMMYVGEDLAKEIDEEYGLKHGTGEVHVDEDERLGSYIRDDRGTIHHYFWGSTRAFADGWDRIFGKKKKKAKKGKKG